jgi:hypothetical protein
MLELSVGNGIHAGDRVLDCGSSFEEEIDELLGLPADIRQAALIPTAYSIGTDFKPGARQSLDDVLHVDRW